MIVKTLSKKGSSAKGLLNYLFKDERKLTDEKFKTKMTLKHNISGKTIGRFTAQFNFNESLRKVKRKDAVTMYHSIISFSNKDRQHINKKMLTDIT